MATDLVMPALTPTMEVGTLSQWLVKPGDKVTAGQVIAEIETDKSILEFEALHDGVIGALYVEDGAEDIAVEAVIGVLLEPGEAAPAADERKSDTAAEGGPASPTHDSDSGRGDFVESARRQGRIAASPSAKRLAREAGIDLATLVGSGPRGRIVAADVRSATVEQPPTTKAAFVEITQSTLQKTMARRMAESKSSVPHLYAAIDVNVDALLGKRAEEKAAGRKATLNDYIVRATALALRATPNMNVQYVDGVVRQFSQADVAVAVATDVGLVTPIVRAAETKPVETIATEIVDLAARAGAKRLHPNEYEGGTFTVSNVGMYGVKQSWPIINPPQAGILGVGRAEESVIAEKGALRVARIMMVTLAADHRCIDGAIVGDFLNSLKEHLQHPDKL